MRYSHLTLINYFYEGMETAIFIPDNRQKVVFFLIPFFQKCFCLSIFDIYGRCNYWVRVFCSHGLFSVQPLTIFRLYEATNERLICYNLKCLIMVYRSISSALVVSA